MIEPWVEGGGCILGLALLYYFQVWRPARTRDPAPEPEADTDQTP